MIGAGGGFVLVPILLLLYPSASPDFMTSISLAVVFFNAGSGTFAYVRQRRVDLLAANMFAAATIPGAVAGALVIGYIPRGVFDVIFALLLLAIAAFLLVRPSPTVRVVQRTHRRGEVVRVHTDREGVMYSYSYNICGRRRHQHGRWLSLQPARHRRRRHPRADYGARPALPDPHRHGDVALRPDGLSPRRHLGPRLRPASSRAATRLPRRSLSVCWQAPRSALRCPTVCMANCSYACLAVRWP